MLALLGLGKNVCAMFKEFSKAKRNHRAIRDSRPIFWKREWQIVGGAICSGGGMNE
jgi:hypothetical protein